MGAAFDSIKNTCTLYPLADMFVPTPSRFLRETYSHAAVTAGNIVVHNYIHHCLGFGTHLYSKLRQRGVNEIAQASKRQQEDSNQGSLDVLL